MDASEARQQIVAHYPSAVGARELSTRELLTLGHSALEIASTASERVPLLRALRVLEGER
jgi:hypothetical protein